MDKKFLNRTLWTLGIFFLAFIFYASTAAYAPYPGQSADFLASLCFRGQIQSVSGLSLWEIPILLLIRLIPTNAILVVTSLAAAFSGAIIIACIFRSVYFSVLYLCRDFAGIRASEYARVKRDVEVCAISIGVMTAMIAVTALPLWAMGTRPLPQTFSIMVLSVLIALAFELRLRSGLIHSRERIPALWDCVLFGSFFFLVALLAWTNLSSLPIVLFAVILVLIPLFERDEAGVRVRLFLWSIGGATAGLMMIGMTALLAGCFPPGSGSCPLSVLLDNTVNLSQLSALYTTAPNAFMLVLFSSMCVLYFGCLPQAYLKMGRPILGQIITLLALGAYLAHVPTFIWDRLGEPTPVAAFAVILSLLMLGLLVGSWVKNWLDAHQSWRSLKAYTVIGIPLFIVFALVLFRDVRADWAAAAGFPIREALHVGHDHYKKLFPQDCKVWSFPSQQGAFILLRRLTTGEQVSPVMWRTHANVRIAMNGKTFGAYQSEDPVLKRLMLIGEAPVQSYLLHSTEYVTPLSPLAEAEMNFTIGEELEHIATHLGETALGETPIGKRTIVGLKHWAAQRYGAASIEFPTERRIVTLRRARDLDPSNKAYPLSIDACEDNLLITSDERKTARCLYSETPWFSNPTWMQADQFESYYGLVQTKGFTTARRLCALRTNARETVLENLQRIYRTNPETLTIKERDVALLSLSEKESGERLLAGPALPEEVALYLCAYPQTEISFKLAARYPKIVKEDECLSFVYQRADKILKSRLPEKVSAFFMRDGQFIHALLHVNLLLKNKELNEARAFVSSFTIAERIPDTVYGLEFLREKVLTAQMKEDPEGTLNVAQMWLRSDPCQQSLWTFLLTHPKLTPDVKKSAMETCLQYYPLHKEASRLLAEELQTSFGEEASNRYKAALNVAFHKLL
ncbi:MAG: hypothetical protein RR417_06510 [Kiritimatiellia bacterium]